MTRRSSRNRMGALATEHLVGGHSLAEWAVLTRFILARRAFGVLAGPLLSKAATQYADALYSTSGATPEIRDRILESLEVDPAQVVEFPFPAGWPMYFRRSKAFDARMRHRLKDVVVSPLSGLTWTASGRIIGESIGSAYRLLGWGNVAHEMLFPVAGDPINSRVVCTVSRNYGHWLFESLPHILEALAECPDTTILLPRFTKDRPPFVEDSLRLALGDRTYENAVRYATQPHRVAELVLTGMPVDPYFIHPSAVKVLRTTYSQHLAVGPRRRALYVSRRASPKRRMDNEAELENMVTECGFEVVSSEDVPFHERIRMFSEAHTVVAPHGAGLSSIVWCSPGTKLIELLPPANFNDYFARLSMMTSLQYRYIQAQPGSHPGGILSLADLEREIGDQG